MFYVGLDVHLKSYVVCVLDSKGNVVKRATTKNLELLLGLLGKLPDHFSICFEASCGYGHIHDQLAKRAARVVVAHPGFLALIYRSKKKNDRRDAEKLAQLLLAGMVPEVHVPTSEVRAWREAISFRRKLIQKRTRAKNAVRALLRSLGIVTPRSPGLWTKHGMTWLQEIEFDQLLSALKRDMLVDEIASFTKQVRTVEKVLKRFAESRVEVWQLQSIPGVGARTAEAVVAFLDDPHRFANSKKVGSYFGLVPSQDQSGGTNRLGHITKEGSATVRQLLTEAVWQSIRRSPTVKAYFKRIHRGDKDRRKIAVVATAHYLVRVMWAMLKRGELWRETVKES